MAESAIQSLTIRHEALMDYMMANPTVKLGDVAKHFGVTQPWLSQIIHSEAFQAMLAIKQEIAFNHTVLGVREKVAAIAHQGLDQIAERLALMDGRTTAQVTQDALDRLGFGSKVHVPVPQAGGTQVHVHIGLKDDLEEARRLIGANRANQPRALEVATDGERTVIALPGTAESNRRPTDIEGTFSPAKAAVGSAAAGH